MKKVLINCIDCGVEFYGSIKRKRCNDCRDKSKYVSIMTDKIFKCEFCNISYKPKNNNQKYCSDNCRDSAKDERFNNNEYTGWHRLRFEVFKRDKFTCQYCGRNVKDDGIKLHCDHIFPKILGGRDIPDNLTTSCIECNLGKSDVLLDNIVLKHTKK